MDREFFDPYKLVKKKKSQNEDILSKLKKQEKSSAPASSNRMDIEEMRPRNRMDIESPKLMLEGAGAAKIIQRCVRSFLARRRLLRTFMTQLNAKVSDLELFLEKYPQIKNKTFLKDKTLCDLLGLAGMIWIAGLKNIYDYQVNSKKKFFAIEELRKAALKLIFRLNDLVLVSFDNTANNKSSLFRYLMIDIKDDDRVLFFLRISIFAHIVKQVDSKFDYIHNAASKKALARFFINLFDCEELILLCRSPNLTDLQTEFAVLLFQEVFLKLNVIKLLSNSFIQFLRSSDAFKSSISKGYLLGFFVYYFMPKLIQKTDSQFISAGSLISNLMTCFEACFAFPISGQLFDTHILKSQSLSATFIDLIEKLPAESLKAYPALTSDSKMNFCLNLMYLLPEFLSLKDAQES